MPTLVLTRKANTGAVALMAYTLLSQTAGVYNDADISMGSTTYGTDSTAAIQALLNAGKPVWWDVKCSVTGLKLPSGAVITGPASRTYGVILRPNANAAVFQNAGWNEASHTWNPNLEEAKFVNRNISIRNIIINHNGANANGNQQVHSSAATGWCCPVRMYCVRDFEMDNCAILAQRTFATHLMNTKYSRFTNCVIDCGPYGVINTDGLHWSGANSDLAAHNCRINAYDDHIGINADDGLDHDTYNNSGGQGGSGSAYYQGSAGGIDRWDIQNITFEGTGIFGVRFLSGASPLGGGTVRGLRGKTRGYAVVIDNYWQNPSFIYAQGLGNIRSIVVEDVNVECTEALNGVNPGIINVNCNADKLVFKNIRRTGFAVNSFPTIAVTGASTAIKELQLLDYVATESAATNTTTPHVLISDAMVSRLVCENVSTTRANTATDSPLVAVTGVGSVETLQLDRASAMNCLNLVYDATTGGMGIKSILATNIDHQGAGSGATFKTAGTIARLAVYPYLSAKLTEGTFTSILKSGFDLVASAPVGSTTNVASGGVVDHWFADARWSYDSNWLAYNNTSGNDALGAVIYYCTTSGRVATMTLVVTQPSYLAFFGNKSRDYANATIALDGTTLPPVYTAYNPGGTTAPDPLNPNWTSASVIQPGTYRLTITSVAADGGRVQIVVDETRLIAA